MNKYDLMLIVDAHKTQDQKDTVFKQAVETVTKSGGKVVNNQVWLERHKFHTKIKQFVEGTYYLIKFEAPTASIEKAKQVLRINDDILRYAFIKAE